MEPDTPIRGAAGTTHGLLDVEAASDFGAFRSAFRPADAAA